MFSQKKSLKILISFDTVVNQVGVTVATASKNLCHTCSGPQQSSLKISLPTGWGAMQIASRAEIKRSHVSVPKLNKQLVSSVSRKCQLNILDNTGSTQSLNPAEKDLFEQLMVTDLDDSAKVRNWRLLICKKQQKSLGLVRNPKISSTFLKPGSWPPWWF